MGNQVDLAAPLTEEEGLSLAVQGAAHRRPEEKRAQACRQKGQAVGSGTYLNPRHFLRRT